jgi:hypothetical protein
LGSNRQLRKISQESRVAHPSVQSTHQSGNGEIARRVRHGPYQEMFSGEPDPGELVAAAAQLAFVFLLVNAFPRNSIAVPQGRFCDQGDRNRRSAIGAIARLLNETPIPG